MEEAKTTERLAGAGDAFSLDARTKIGLMLLYSVALFAASSGVGVALLGAMLVLAAFWQHVPLARLVRDAVPIYVIGAFLLVYQGVANDWGVGALVAARVVLLAWGSLLLVLPSTPTELSDALAQLMAPLARVGLPVRDITCALSLALRFMPLMAEELAAVRAAQASRGASFDAGSPWMRLKAACGLMVPVLVGLYRRADRLASAMDARCFGASNHATMLNERKMTPRDWSVLAVGAFLCALAALVP